MSAPSGVRLTVVLDHPIQYFAPAFRKLEGSRTVDMTVLYWNSQEAGFYDPDFGMDVKWDVDLLSGYRFEVARGDSPVQKIRSALHALRTARPQVILLFGWADAITRTALLWSVVRRVPTLLYGDSTPQHSATGRRGLAARVQLRALMRLATGAFTTGAFNEDFYIRFGMRRDRFYPGVLPADIDLYAKGLSAKKGENFTIGYVGKLIERKGVDELLDALAALETREWRALIVGEGPERGRLEDQASRLGIADRVDFTGFRNQTELPELIGSCHVLVVPSTIDFRVLVVAEAMAAGTPVIVSSNTAVWGPGDLIEHDVTGLVYTSGNDEELAASIERLMRNPAHLQRLRDAATARAQRYGAGTFARRLEVAADALARRKASPKHGERDEDS